MTRRLLVGLMVCSAGCVDFDARIDQCRDGGGLCAPDSGTGGGPTCTATQLLCEDSCVNAMSDPAHCGACTTRCGATETCYGGQCRTHDCADSQCGADEVCLEGSCTQRACLDVFCSLQTTCVGGSCLPRACNAGACGQGLACLDGGCVDVSCRGVTCADGGVCQIGRCDGTIGCLNNIKDPNESDTDCGGICPPCVDGNHCRVPQDCASTNCGDGGICLPVCASGASCGTNPGVPCKVGAVACVGGAAQCTDGANEANGLGCGADHLCQNGVCTACVANQPCTTNPDPCKDGVTACTAGASCTNGAAKAAGSSCGPGQVCSAAGVCTPCSAAAACTSNVSSPCKLGAVSCATGLAQCLDGANADTGTNCGIERICQAGACISCAAGMVCVTNPSGPCKSGVTSCGATPGCVDGANVAGGTSCGNGQVCNGNGQCVSCVAGQSCTTNPSSPCRTGVTDCSAGAQKCLDSSNATAGTTCGTNQVCNGAGTCVSCTAGAACAGNPNPGCHDGVTACGTGATTCVDGAAKGAGTLCGGGQVCDMNGFCGACVANQACSGNPTACKAGVTSCGSGSTSCVDSTNRPAGASCGTDLVCNGSGACVSCAAGQACNTNPNPCFAGITSCATGAQTCVNGAQKLAGSSCGTNLVCDGAGACSACTANAACATNPSPCMTGITSCSSGAQTCGDFGFRAPGFACGSNQVCNGSGSCVSCSAGQACANNPGLLCFNGITSCSSGAQTCGDGTRKPAGTSCGTNQVCNASGQCAGCSAGLSCNTNPNSACASGVTSCGTGVQTCVDGALLPVGTTCGGNQVCNASGACVACTAGSGCTGNPNPCRNGTTSCSTGASVCVDGSVKGAGTSCGAGQVCDSGGSCGACTAGQACATNPGGSCINGVTSCSSGTTTCVDGTPRGAGTACGVNLVCNGSNQCVACTSGTTCGTNPGNLCKNGVTSCSTGASVCVDGTDKAPGTICGNNQVCNAGACVACTAGNACGSNPGNLCKNGTTVCSSGTSVCADGSLKPAGTSCGTNQVCNASGSCVACTAGSACSSNPNALCAAGVTSCSSGSPTCLNGSPLPPGTNCGTNQVCDNAATCVSCTSGGACSGNPSICKNGTNSCATGALTCVDSGNKPGGTTCGTNKVCDGNGTCGDCTAGLSCSGNPGGICYAGVTSCATGSTSCVDGTPRATGSSCGTGLVCNAAHACVSCAAGSACSTNPSPCRNGVTSCNSGVATCVDSLATRPAGTTCGTNLVCDSSANCVACAAGTICSTNPNPCYVGLLGCSNGPQCFNSNAKPPGSSCGAMLTCNASLQCVACAVGTNNCYTNTDQCRYGNTTACPGGVATCVNGAYKPASSFTSCGPGLYCDGSGGCSACVPNLECTTNPDAPAGQCDGYAVCDGGTLVGCVDGAPRC